MAESKILGAKTFKAFVEAVNEHFDLQLPTDFRDRTPLASLWNTAVRVLKKQPQEQSYTATGTLTGFPFGFAQQVQGKRFRIRAEMTVTETLESSE